MLITDYTLIKKLLHKSDSSFASHIFFTDEGFAGLRNQRGAKLSAVSNGAF
jgi:hypothetical protein